MSFWYSNLCGIIFTIMSLQTAVKHISDAAILSLISENSLEGWGHLYDKYAPAMYGIIYNYTKSKFLAEDILIKLFIKLHEKESTVKINFPLSVYIMRYTHSSTREELKNRDIKYIESPVKENSILHIFCSQFITLKEVAANLGITNEQARKNLYSEFLLLRSQNEVSHPRLQEILTLPELRYTFSQLII